MKKILLLTIFLAGTLLTFGQVPGCQLDEFLDDVKVNPELSNAVKENADLVDAWKAIDNELADVGEVIRKNPDALKNVDNAAKEGLDGLDAVEDAVQATGKTRPTWEEIQVLFKRGNDFNRKAATEKWYRYNEVHLSNGKRLDSYDAVKGEIVSRKATDFNTIQKSTFENYLKEMQNKYSAGTTIRSNKYPDLDGQQLSGKQILEIPASNSTFPKLQEYVDLAQTYGIEIRFRPE